ncbi:hypothetical protein SAMN05216236_10334 [Sedimentitalea nanhaiensis]|uniref:Uncharacterized protein n=1 Tax=Sedimentitalea nanhaiensis TaxID=999627 RepID=A0A1I6YUM4_9RHOB|nr:hypothetical protein SAMN05216236_10334 [Sedimentitalea nanhaiensis]
MFASTPQIGIVPDAKPCAVALAKLSAMTS